MSKRVMVVLRKHRALSWEGVRKLLDRRTRVASLLREWRRERAALDALIADLGGTRKRGRAGRRRRKR